MVVGIIIRLTVGLFAGLFLFWMFPVFAGLIPIKTIQEKAVEPYYRMAANAMERMVLVLRSNGGWKLCASRYNTDYDTERVRLSGEARDFKDEKNLMSRLYGKPFGMAIEDLAVIINPLVADFGRKLREQDISGELEREVADESCIKQHFLYDRQPELVNLNDAKAVVQGSQPPSRARQAEEFVKKGNAVFDRQPLSTYMIWLTCLGSGFGLPWIANEVGPTGGGGGVDVPISVSLFLIQVVI